MKCIKCGRKTKFSLSFDIDLPNIPAHKKCAEDVQFAFFMEDDLRKTFTKKWFKPL